MASATERTMTHPSPTSMTADELIAEIEKLRADYGDVNHARQVWKERAEKAEAQLATRLPDREEIARIVRDGTAKQFGPFEDNEIDTADYATADAILALLSSGAATPAPTAAVTAQDVDDLFSKSASIGEFLIDLKSRLTGEPTP